VDIGIDFNSAFRWSQAFGLLGSRRTARYFAELGLPPAVAAEPDRLVWVSQKYCEYHRQMIDQPGWVSPRSWDRLLTGAMVQLAKAYGQPVADWLMRWIWLHLVDEEQRSTLLLWRMRFPDIQRRGLNALDRANLTPPLAARVLEVVRDAWSGRPTGPDISREEAAVKAATMDAEDLEILMSPLEILLPFGLLELHSLLQSHRVMETWQRLLVLGDRRLLEAWALARAEADGWFGLEPIPEVVVSNNVAG
jgi:hypothetical protein